MGLWRCLFISETQASFQGWILEQPNRSNCRAAEEVEGKVMNEDSMYGQRRNGTDSTKNGETDSREITGFLYLLFPKQP